MDLFTYLMSKNNHNTSVHGDLFSYLLGKNGGTIKTISGTEINITDAKNRLINRLEMSKLSSQNGEPSPENPVEIKTVKGYRNLFDKNGNFNYGNGKPNTISLNEQGQIVSTANSYEWRAAGLLIENLKANKNYIISGTLVSATGTSTNNTTISIMSITNSVISNNNISKLVEKPYHFRFTFDTGDNTSIWISLSGRDDNASASIMTVFDNVQLTEGTEELPYVPYGNNYVYTKVTNGTDTNYYTIPLNGNEIAGIGDYKDELIVDSDGHCWLNKKTGKVVLDGSENWLLNSTSGDQYRYWLHNEDFSDVFINMIEKQEAYYHDTVLTNYFTYALFSNTSIGKFSLNNRLNVSWFLLNMDITTLENFKTWLSSHNTEILYPLETPEIIDLNYDVDIRLFKGVNNISNSDDMDMLLKYY